VAPLLERCPTIELPTGALLHEAPIAAAALLVIERGVVAVTTPRTTEAGRRMTVVIAREGDLVVPPGEREELTALDGAAMTVIAPDVFALLLAIPEAAALVVERLVEAVRERQLSLAQFASVDRAERVRAKLLQLARAHGRVTRTGIQLDLPLTHELLAQTTGSARETVSYALAALAREGFVVREGRRYRITVPPELLAQ